MISTPAARTSPNQHVRRALLVPLFAMVVAAALFITPTSPATATKGGPRVMTATSWYGVKLGASLSRVARSHGWSTGSCLGGSVPDYINVPRRYGVAIARGARAGRVGFIEVGRNRKIRGPHGVRLRIPTSRIADFLDKGTRHHATEGIDSGTEWNYWVIPMKGHFLFVRSYGSDPERVSSFGLAISRAVANERGRTQGGCY